MTLESTTSAPAATPAHQSPAPIVVGVDNSAASLAALRWAAIEAVGLGAPLVALHVHDPRNRQRAAYAQFAVRGEDPNTRPAEAEELIERSLTSIEQVFEIGVPSEILVRRATGARMLVLGHAEQHRRHDDEPFRHEAALGPVARACVARATCPVVIVPIPAGIGTMTIPAETATAPHRIPEVVGACALYPRVRATSVAR